MDVEVSIAVRDEGGRDRVAVTATRFVSPFVEDAPDVREAVTLAALDAVARAQEPAEVLYRRERDLEAGF